jgi:dipeptidase D
MPEKEIEQLQPKEFWENFAAICKIPHPSGNEVQLCNFIKKFAEDLGLEVSVDAVGNLFVKKLATSGMEDRPIVVLQAHLDMVSQKNSEVAHDFDKDPLQIYVDSGWVKAQGTTLGADDGVGLAAIMTILQSKTLKHGPLEVVLTVDEEVNFTGVNAIKPGDLAGRILLNLDADHDDEITIGSGGGIFIEGNLAFEKVKVPKNVQAFILTASGLKGGHSALEIDKASANAIKIVNRIIWLCRQKFDLNLVKFDAGSAYNATPRDASAVVLVANDDLEEFKKFLREQSEFLIELSATIMPDLMPEQKAQASLINLLYAIPNGVIEMSKVIAGLIETSNNLAMVETKNNSFKVCSFPRSSVESTVDEMINIFTALFAMVNGQVNFFARVPAWQPNPNSLLVKLLEDVYTNKFGEKPKIIATHAGTECGVFLASYPDMQIVSIGPNIENCHSPDERLSVESVAKYWEFLVAILENIPKK